MKSKKPMKNSLFTIIAFVIVIGLVVLCICSLFAGKSSSDDTKPAATSAPVTTVVPADASQTQTPEADSSVVPDSGKKNTEQKDTDSKAGNTTTDSKNSNGSKSQTTDKKDKKDTKKPAATKAPSNNSGTLTDQEATGQDNEISFDDFQ